ncbi:MAG: hypothetical protein ACYCT9_00425 [Leptospirillum sp.]
MITREEFLGAVADELVAVYDENGEFAYLTLPLDRVLTAGIWGKQGEDLDEEILTRIESIARCLEEEENGGRI